jgi:hypothetical protein
MEIDIFLKTPFGLTSRFLMDTANEPIKIYEGYFNLKLSAKDITLDGKIEYNWTPNPFVSFKGNVLNPSCTTMEVEVEFDQYLPLYIDGTEFGHCKMTEASWESTMNIKDIVGKLHKRLIFGNQATDVEYFRFVVPNLRSLPGELVQQELNGGRCTYGSRLVLSNQHYIITLDQRRNHDILHDKLEKTGGYILIYNAEVKKINGGKINSNEAVSLNSCFGKYLTLINGSRISPIFIEGIKEENALWTDYSIYDIDPYKNNITFSKYYLESDLDALWNSFSHLWKTDEEFLTSVINWYVEANSTTDYIDRNLILVQTALELIYNWFVIEKGQLLYGLDADNINAANKIRLLLSQLNVKSEIPKRFTALQKTLNGRITDLKDGPGVTTYIRNCIVHSKAKNRDNLKLITEDAKNQALQLCLWYVELSILKILRYNGKYYNRCSKETFQENKEELVPWI